MTGSIIVHATLLRIAATAEAGIVADRLIQLGRVSCQPILKRMVQRWNKDTKLICAAYARDMRERLGTCANMRRI